MSNIVRFKSCFICEVIIDDKSIELVDSGHQSFFIDKNDSSAMLDFKSWFKDIYKACVPQTLTVVQYEPVHDDESGGMMLKAVKLIYKKNDSSSSAMLNESKGVQQ